MRNRQVQSIALGGVLAGLAVVFLSLGTLVPGTTYVCPLLCLLLCKVVYEKCGAKLAWTWYAAVALLGLLLSPDKEAAGVFLALGSYPIVKPIFEKSHLRWFWKLLFFNVLSIGLYWVLISLMGLEVEGDTVEAQRILLLVLLALGNVTFLVTDFLLTTLDKRYFHRKKA